MYRATMHFKNNIYPVMLLINSNFFFQFLVHFDQVTIIMGNDNLRASEPCEPCEFRI